MTVFVYVLALWVLHGIFLNYVLNIVFQRMDASLLYRHRLEEVKEIGPTLVLICCIIMSPIGLGMTFRYVQAYCLKIFK